MTAGKARSRNTWLLLTLGTLMALILGCGGGAVTTQAPEPIQETTAAPEPGTVGTEIPRTDGATTPEETQAPQVTTPPAAPTEATVQGTPGKTAEPTLPAVGRKTAEAPTEEPRSQGPDREPSDGPARPDNSDEVIALIQALQEEQQECLPQNARDGWVDLDPDSIVSTFHARTLREVTECLTDENIARLMVIPGMERGMNLTEEEKTCIAGSNAGTLVKTALKNSEEYPALFDALFIANVGTTLNAEACAGDRVWEETGMGQQNRSLITCIIRTPEEALEMMNAVTQGDEQRMEELETRAAQCAKQFPPEPLPESHAECTQEDRDAGALCREE